MYDYVRDFFLRYYVCNCFAVFKRYHLQTSLVSKSRLSTSFLTLTQPWQLTLTNDFPYSILEFVSRFKYSVVVRTLKVRCLRLVFLATNLTSIVFIILLLNITPAICQRLLLITCTTYFIHIHFY